MGGRTELQLESLQLQLHCTDHRVLVDDHTDLIYKSAVNEPTRELARVTPRSQVKGIMTLLQATKKTQIDRLALCTSPSARVLISFSHPATFSRMQFLNFRGIEGRESQHWHGNKKEFARLLGRNFRICRAVSRNGIACLT